MPLDFIEYDVNATGNPTPTFALTVFPAGMTINPTTGLISWTPTALGLENVTVTAENKLVQNTESSLSMLVNEQTIVTLPLNGRNPLHLIGLVPGVVGHSAEATASGGTSTQYINGDRGRGITTTQDGIDIGDPVIPRGELTNAPVNPDAVEGAFGRGVERLCGQAHRRGGLLRGGGHLSRGGARRKPTAGCRTRN